MRKLYYTVIRLVSANKRELLFLVMFAGIFTALQSLYYFSRHISLPLVIQSANTAVSAAIINLITPAEQVAAHGKTLQSASGYALEIAWGCEGVEGISLVIAALIACTMTVRRKLTGIVIGTVFLMILNLLRIVVLYYTVKYYPSLFDLMHIYVGQTFIIFFGLMFFIAWTWYYTAPVRE